MHVQNTVYIHTCVSMLLYMSQKRLGGVNIGEFGVWTSNCQSFLPQIYETFNVHLPLLGHSPNSSPPKRLNEKD